jgi:hypothetical protein
MRTIFIVAAILLASAFTVGSAGAQKTALVHPRSATLQQQKMCAEQADKKFGELDEYKPSQRQADIGEDIEHTSHFEAGANVCYVTAYMLLQQDEVYDAFEGRRYARFLYLGQGKKYDDTDPVDCRLKPRGQTEIKCNSWAEYQELIEKHFGIGQ